MDSPFDGGFLAGASPFPRSDYPRSGRGSSVEWPHRARSGIDWQIYSVGFTTSTERFGMSINEIKTTVFGFMGTQPTRLGQPGSTPVCSFRLGSTPAYYDAAAGVWKRKSTTWLTVKAFRTLAVNALACLHKGDPVIVSGSLVTEEWTSDGQPHSSLVLVADGIGHDLARGQDTFTRIQSGVVPIDEEADGPDPWTTPLSSSSSETGSAPASSVSSAADRTSVKNSNAG